MSRLKPFTIVPLIVVLGLTGCGSSKMNGITQLPVIDLSKTTLPEVTNASGTTADYKLVAPAKGLMVLYFGYTSCPDICPTTLSDLHTAITGLGKSQSRVTTTFVTVDRNRDTAPVLTSYLGHFGFGSDGHVVRPADDTQLKAVESIVHASSSVTTAADGSDTVVGHTAWLYAVNDRGIVVEEWAFGTKPSDISSDLKHLLSKQTA